MKNIVFQQNIKKKFYKFLITKNLLILLFFLLDLKHFLILEEDLILSHFQY